MTSMIEMNTPPLAPPDAFLNDVQNIVESGITRWYQETRSFSSLKALDISLKTNTTLLEKRGNLIVKALKKYAPTLFERPTLRMLDIGFGFGTIGLYVRNSLRVSNMVGIDADPICLETCQAMVDRLGLKDVQYQLDDMTQMATVEGQFDLLLSNNSFCFITETQQIKAAIANFYKHLAPGGTIIIYAPNKWHLKEAFTGLNGVQFLPRPLANWYARFRGYPEDYTVRLLSPNEMTSWFKEAGFSDPQIISPYREMTNQGRERLFKPYYLFMATKPNTTKPKG